MPCAASHATPNSLTLASPPFRDLAFPPARSPGEPRSRAARRKDAIVRDRLTVRTFGDALLSAVDAAESLRPVNAAQLQRMLQRHAGELRLVDVAAFRTVARRRGLLAEQWLRELVLERLP